MLHEGLLIALVCMAAEPKQGNPSPEPGFVSLFNGKDLTGWREVQGLPGAFTVQNGVLIGHRKTKALAYWLSTNESHRDFDLRLQYKLKPGGNSGVFIRVPSYKGRTSRQGMEIQLLDDGASQGSPSVGNTGAIYQVVAPKTFAARPAGEWNDLEITCSGNLVKVTLNGKELNNVNMSEVPGLKNRPLEGYIGLSAHTDTVAFRNIRLREPPGP